jgi:antitoxin YefM
MLEQLEAEIERLERIIALDPNDLLAKSDLSSCIETVYLLKSPVNVRHLMASLEEYRSGKLVPQSIEELRQEFGISGE